MNSAAGPILILASTGSAPLLINPTPDTLFKANETVIVRLLIPHFLFIYIPAEDTDQQVIDNIRPGVKALRLSEKSKMKAKPFQEFIDIYIEVTPPRLLHRIGRRIKHIT